MKGLLLLKRDLMIEGPLLNITWENFKMNVKSSLISTTRNKGTYRWITLFYWKESSNLITPIKRMSK